MPGDVLAALAAAADGHAATAGAADTVEGVPPAYVVSPGSVEQIAAVMRATAEHDLAVVVRGGASKLGQGAPPRRADVVVDLTRMDRVLEHAAGDLVARVQPGVRLDALQAALGESRQRLALDPPEPGATVGGVVSAAASGPLRQRFGTPRDLLIGLSVVLADGTVAKAGGKVVKNVAGYDLGKLFTGAFGTLGVVAECVVRLHPRPPARRVVTFAVGEDAAARLAATVVAEPVVPSAVELSGGALHVLFEGVEPAVVGQAQRVAALGDATVAEQLPDGFGRRPYTSRAVGLKLTHEIAGLPRVLAAVRGCAGGDAEVSAHAGAGVTWVGCDPGVEEAPEVVAGLREALAAVDGTVVVVQAPLPVKAGVDVWGPVRGLELMRRVKDRFDPEARMAPGRFVGGI